MSLCNLQKRLTDRWHRETKSPHQKRYAKVGNEKAAAHETELLGDLQKALDNDCIFTDKYTCNLR